LTLTFEKHFAEEEQDKGLKKFFWRTENKSAILNWLIEGYRLLGAEGLQSPQRIVDATRAYRQEADVIGSFIIECTAAQDGFRLPVKELYAAYSLWAKDNGYRQMNSKNFIAELRRRFDVRRGGVGYMVVGLMLDDSLNPFVA